MSSLFRLQQSRWRRRATGVLGGYRAPLYTLPTGITFDSVLGFVGTVIDTTYSEPSTVVTLTDQGSAAANTTALQAAIDAAAVASTGGTTIVLPAGSTYNGITLRARSGDGGWVYLVSSQRNLLPLPQAGDEPGDWSTRVTPADAAYMPKIVNIGAGAFAISVEKAAHHYRLVGLDCTTADTAACFNLVFLSLDPDIDQNHQRIPGTGMDNAANFPHHVGVDRCYLHGSLARTDMLRAVFLDAYNGFVVGCHISDVVHTGQDAQAVLLGRVPGPFKICNNWLEATGENLMVGGVDAEVAGVVPSDIEIRRNYGYKPLTWNQYDPSYDGIARDIKNTWELKKGIRVLFEGNVAQNCWFGSGSQYYVVNIKCTDQGGGDTWAETHDVTFAYNKLLNVYGGWSLAGHPESNPIGSPAHRVDIYDNLLVHGDPTLVGPGLASQLATVAFNQTGPGFAFRHNSCPGANQNSIFFTSGPSQDVVLTDNLFRRTPTWGGAAGGVKGDGAESPAAPNDGSAIFDAYTTSHTFAGNGFYDAAGGTTTQRASYVDNALLDAIETDVFVNPAAGNYRLLAGLFAGAATDGGTPGANLDLVDAATAGAIP